MDFGDDLRAIHRLETEQRIKKLEEHKNPQIKFLEIINPTTKQL